MKNLIVIAALSAVAAAALAAGAPTWIKNDDGVPYVPVYRMAAGDGWAVKLTPPGPGYIQQLKMYVGNPPGNTGWDGFNVEIWTWNATLFPTTPGQRVWGPKPWTYSAGGWVTFANVDFHWDSSLPFVVLVKQREAYPDCDTLYCDSGRTTPNPNLSYFSGKWSYFVIANGDFLLRAFYGECYPGVEPTSLGRIKTLYL